MEVKFLEWAYFAGWAGIKNGYWAPNNLLFILALVIAT
jgi:hypothetical protein